MKIAVIGPGAMGLLFGGYLSQHHDVTLVGTNPVKMQSITKMALLSARWTAVSASAAPCCCRHRRPLPCRPGHRAGQGQRLEAALTKNKALIGPDTILMTLQNGMGHETLLSRFAAP